MQKDQVSDLIELDERLDRSPGEFRPVGGEEADS
jgi:hypothetical protein